MALIRVETRNPGTDPQFEKKIDFWEGNPFWFLIHFFDCMLVPIFIPQQNSWLGSYIWGGPKKMFSPTCDNISL